MTGPLGGESVGSAWINIHANTDNVEPDLRKGLNKAGRESEKDADNIGRDVGDHIGKGVETEIGRHSKTIGKAIGDAVDREEIQVRPDLRYNLRGRDGRFISKAAAGIRSEVEEAFSSATSKGGFFSKLGEAISDAIGSGFNVSGKSPLIIGLIPVIGAVIGLVGAALQALNALAAAATTLPALLAAVGLQAGVLMLAFRGISEAVSGAFAAKNAKELNEALKGLTPSAQKFVRSLLPLKKLFKDLQALAQEGFFKGLGDSVGKVITKLSPILRKQIGQLAQYLGRALAAIIGVFSGPEFSNFINRVIPATEVWLRDFGPAFGTFLLGLINLSNAAIPLLSALGGLLNAGLSKLGTELTKISSSKEFRQWLAQMFKTLTLLGPLVAAVFGFVVQFLSTLNKAGGNDLIKSLTDVVNMLTAFLTTEAGLRAMNELIGIAIASFYILAGAAIAVLFLGASIQAFIQWLLDVAIPAVVDAIVWLGLTIESGVKWLGSFFAGLGEAIWHAIQFIWHAIVDWFEGVLKGFYQQRNAILQEVGRLPQRIMEALGDLGNLLLRAGQNLIQGLIRGITQAIPGLRTALSAITSLLPSWKGPEDKDRKILVPAGKAVMEGFGAGLLAGATDIKSLLGDFTTGLGGLGVNANSTQILFGADAVSVNFRGALPTTSEAANVGMSVGAGIVNQLAARNTRLAVRTL